MDITDGEKLKKAYQEASDHFDKINALYQKHYTYRKDTLKFGDAADRAFAEKLIVLAFNNAKKAENTAFKEYAHYIHKYGGGVLDLMGITQEDIIQSN